MGGELVAGGKMKSTTGWIAPNTGATNSSGFAGLPGGALYGNGLFGGIGGYGYWWSSAAYLSLSAYYCNLTYDSAKVNFTTINKTTRYSVRCVRN